MSPAASERVAGQEWEATQFVRGKGETTDLEVDDARVAHRGENAALVESVRYLALLHAPNLNRFHCKRFSVTLPDDLGHLAKGPASKLLHNIVVAGSSGV